MALDQKMITDMGLLSQFSYKDLDIYPILKGQSVSQFSDDGKTYILNSSYTVIDYTSHSTDMQAILLEKNDGGGNPTGEYVIAFRGTEPNSARDWITNALTGLINYNPQVSAGKSFVLEMMSKHSISVGQLTLTGHSLGGIITQAVGADLHIQGYSFNPYGANLLSSLPPMPHYFYYSVLGHVLDLFEMGDKNDPWIKDNLLTVSYQDNGSLNGDILSNLLTEFSEIIAGNDHLGGVLPIFGDNVGFFNGHGIPGLNVAINRYNEILAKFTSEATYSDLSTAYLLGGKDGFNSVNQALSALQINGVPDGSLSLELFADSPTGDLVLLSSNEIQSLAQNDIAYRYALVHLNPFAVLGVDYSRFNTKGELDLVNPTTGQGLSEQYLEDRAKFLALKNELAVADATYGPINLPELEGYYVDRSTGLVINNTEYSTRETAPEFIFGSDGVDVIESFRSLTLPISRDDHVFGGAGNDIIRTYEGDDYLEGGPGQDSMDGGAGDDTFFVQGTDTDYDVFRGGPGADKILGSKGNDTIRVHRFTGEDTVEVIDGGEGFDVIAGTDGEDIIDLTGTSLISIERIEGGKGNDTILGSMGNDTIHGGEDDDVITGNKGDDLLVGGPGRDVYVYAEGDGHDTIIDSGDNLIQLRLADGSIVPVGDFLQKDASTWESADGWMRLVHNTTWKILVPGGGSIDLGAGFTEGDYGIRLLNPSSTALTLTGTAYRDEMGVDTYPANWELHFASFPPNNSSTVLFQQQLPSTAPRMHITGGASGDFLFGFQSRDEIYGGDGGDIISGHTGVWNNRALNLAGPLEGDYLDGGAGGDFITGSGGADQIFGGDGDDFLEGLNGDDLLDLDRYASGFLSGTNWVGLADFDSLVDTLPQTAAIAALLDEFNVRRLTAGDDNAWLTNNADIALAGMSGSRHWRDGGRANDAWRMAA